MVGPLANESPVGNCAKEPKQKVTPLEGIRNKVGSWAEVVYSQGVKLLKDFEGWNPDIIELEDDEANLARIDEAADAVKDCEVIILCLGSDRHMAREAYSDYHRGDNASLELRSMQNELVKRMADTGKPVIVLLYNGGPLAFEVMNSLASAVLECWFPGQENGTAAADILFGDVNPGGKLPITIPRSSGQLPVFYNHKPSARNRSYLFEDIKPLYPFGYGMSYTRFEYGNLRIYSDRIAKGVSTQVLVDVKNTGSAEGAEIVQLYLRDRVSSITRPVKELKGFVKILLKPGETKSVKFLITPETLGFYNDQNEFVVEPGEFEIMVGSSSEQYESIMLAVY